MALIYIDAGSAIPSSRPPTSVERQMQIDIDDTFVEVENMPLTACAHR